VRLSFCYRDSPSVVVRNTSKTKKATSIRYQTWLFELTPDAGAPCNFFSETVPDIDFIPPGMMNGPNPLHITRHCTDNAPSPPSDGDKLFGFVSVWCSDCADRALYWVYLEYRKTAVFAEGKPSEYPADEFVKPSVAMRAAESFLKRRDLKRFAEERP
jgi:hypothetical protein